MVALPEFVIPELKPSPIKNFSVSQYDNFVNDCERWWWFKSVARWSPSPPNESAQRGTDVHSLIDKKLLHGTVPTGPLAPFVRGFEKWFPEPGEDVAVELWIDMPSMIAGYPWKGRIDLFRYTHKPPILIDWKTTSDIRYAKTTPDELYRNVQLASYAMYAWHEGLEGLVRSGLVFVEVPKPDDKGVIKIPKSIKAKPGFVDLDRDRVRPIWEGTEPNLEKMLRVAEIEDWNDVKPNTNSCNKFGGCPYKRACGISPLAGITKSGRKSNAEKTKDKESIMGFVERMKAKQNGQAAPAAPAPTPPALQVVPQQQAVTPAPEPTATQPAQMSLEETAAQSGFQARMAAKAAEQAQQQAQKEQQPQQPQPEQAQQQVQEEPVQVRPPDGPAPDTTAPLAPGDPGAPKAKRGRPPKTAENESAAPAAKAKNGFRLFIDCFIVKGSIEPVVSAEEWLAPAIDELNAWSMKEREQPHYMLLDFAENKAMFAMAVADKITQGLPTAMYVNTGNQLGKDLLPFLLPHAREVIRRL